VAHFVGTNETLHCGELDEGSDNVYLGTVKTRTRMSTHLGLPSAMAEFTFAHLYTLVEELDILLASKNPDGEGDC
jgi:hypothetical protein